MLQFMGSQSEMTEQFSSNNRQNIILQSSSMKLRWLWGQGVREMTEGNIYKYVGDPNLGQKQNLCSLERT